MDYLIKEDLREISQIQFGVFSADEIRKMSVALIHSSKLQCNKNNSLYGTVYDPRLGTIENNTLCETCGQATLFCVGHFGHIELSQPVLHPLFMKRIVDFLSCFCVSCSELRINEEVLRLNGITQNRTPKRFLQIMRFLQSRDLCIKCHQVQPAIRIADTDIHLLYKGKSAVTMRTEEIGSLFERITDADIRMLGFDPVLFHPRNLILSAFPVLPIACRPYIISAGNTCDDDLTIQLIEIIKANNKLAKDKIAALSEIQVEKLVQTLNFRIRTFYNNSNGRAKHTTNSRPMKGLKERITGKDGIIRGALLGKRCEMNARTVIDGDPTLRLGQVGIPESFAKTLTVSECVNRFNKEWLSEVVNTGRANFVVRKSGLRVQLDFYRNYSGTLLEHGDELERDGRRFAVLNTRERLKPGDVLYRNNARVEVEYPRTRVFQLEVGDIVERHLQDGDYVIINRQPTLHSGSMLGHQVVIRPGKNMRLNLATCKSFNADFDGDEANLHLFASEEAKAELAFLSHCKFKMMSAQGSKNIFCIIQDVLLALYMMTIDNKPVRKSVFFNIMMSLNLDGIDWRRRAKEVRLVLHKRSKPAQFFTSRGLVSLILPSDLFYEKHTKVVQSEPTLVIHRGVLVEGGFDKSVLGSSHYSLIQIIHKEYGEDATARFIDNIQFLGNAWMAINGFSVGIEDCIVSGKEQEQEIKNVVQRCYMEAEAMKIQVSNKERQEARITAVLSKARDVGMRIAKDAIKPSNNFLKTVYSGSKGDFFNIAQITGLLGQQNLMGKRIAPSLNDNSRTLPHYPFGQLTMEEDYESKGFISSSFIKGLNPREFFFHAASARENCADTALNTANSGYLERRIVKLCEDLKVQYDGTVRNSAGDVVQSAYDYNNLDPTMALRKNDKLVACDVSRIIHKLNMS